MTRREKMCIFLPPLVLLPVPVFLPPPPSQYILPKLMTTFLFYSVKPLAYPREIVSASS